MNTTIMVEWLHSFYLHIGQLREVLLTMDNFSAHYSAVEIAPPPPNIRICWLPANSTSRFQPLDQGIIQSFKAHYRRQWLSYMLGCFNTNHNPMDTMNLWLAVRWTVRSWNQYLSNTTIYNCFRKSTLITTPIALTTPITPPDLLQLYKQVLDAGNIRDSMAISNFLSPEEEIQGMEESGHTVDEEEVFEEVMGEHLEPQTQDDDEDEGRYSEQPVHSVQDAQRALQVLIEYIEGQEALPVDHTRAIERLEAAIEGIRVNSQIQSTLDPWLM
jgi:hypothetical protein